MIRWEYKASPENFKAISPQRLKSALPPSKRQDKHDKHDKHDQRGLSPFQGDYNTPSNVHILVEKPRWIWQAGLV